MIVVVVVVVVAAALTVAVVVAVVVVAAVVVAAAAVVIVVLAAAVVIASSSSISSGGCYFCFVADVIFCSPQFICNSSHLLYPSQMYKFNILTYTTYITYINDFVVDGALSIYGREEKYTQNVCRGNRRNYNIWKTQA